RSVDSKVSLPLNRCSRCTVLQDAPIRPEASSRAPLRHGARRAALAARLLWRSRQWRSRGLLAARGPGARRGASGPGGLSGRRLGGGRRPAGGGGRRWRARLQARGRLTPGAVAAGELAFGFPPVVLVAAVGPALAFPLFVGAPRNFLFPARLFAPVVAAARRVA